jgi:ribosome-associated translation inhibitor RaiA
MGLIYIFPSPNYIMNKILSIGIFLFLFSGLIFSMQNMNKDNASENMQIGTQIKEQVQAQIKQLTENKMQIQNQNVTANTDMELTQEQNQIRAQLSNGKYANIMVMPDVASDIAMERLRLRVCSEENNCTIELKETGQGNETKAMYEVKAEKKARLFGLIQMKMQVKAQVNAENGEVMKEERPWWAFLAIEEDE